jgi:hypothetical protein
MTDHTQSPPVRKRFWLTMTVLVVVMGLTFWGIKWIAFARQPLPEAVEALASDDLVTITQEPWLSFFPAQNPAKVGFIFYPGGRIDPGGYAPLMKSIANDGYLVVVPEMPLNIAAFQPNIADEVIAYFPSIRLWVIGGHSVGGTMAAQYTNAHRETINGLVIWASYPADNTDLSDYAQSVASIYGSRDPRVNDKSVAERVSLLPSNTRYFRIEGGDHHQFGSYEIDPDEHHAAISRTSQQEQILQATLEILREAAHLD